MIRFTVGNRQNLFRSGLFSLEVIFSEQASMRTMGKLTLFLLLLFFSACEELPPVPQRPETTSSSKAAPAEFDEETRPSMDSDSGVYQYATYRDMPYRILIPRDYDSTKVYPLHLFLHGIGERGTDNEKQLTVGAARFQADSVREKYPAFIIFPQCPMSSYWFSNDIMQTLGALIDTLVNRYLIDRDNISIGGFSMGAYGTFAMVAEHPGLFEAAVAIAGDGDADRASDMAKPRWQLFAGRKDEIVASNKTERMARALADAGALVAFKLYPEADHGTTLFNAFSEPGFFYSLFSERDNGGDGPFN